MKEPLLFLGQAPALDIARDGMIWGNCLVGAWGHDYNPYEKAARG